MNQTPSRGQGRYGARSPIKAPIMKGLFADGVWKCNCDPRMPADHFQTKNGGPNHGRWFYTCQKPQTKRCNFFLWDNEAKAREARTVLSNSHTEPQPGAESIAPSNLTPSKNSAQLRSPITPYSKSMPGPEAIQSVPARGAARPSDSKRDDDWLHVSDDSDDNELRQMVDQAGIRPPETPSKSIKRNPISSPSKRTHDDFEEHYEGRLTYGKPADDIDLFNTPNETRGRGLFSGAQTAPQARGTNRTAGLVSPGITPVANRFDPPRHLVDSSEKIPAARDESPTARKSNTISYPNLDQGPETPSKPQGTELQMTPLAKQVIDALHNENVKVTEVISNSVRAISLKHTNELSNVQKSRDWCREKIRKQATRIGELEAEIAKLKGLSAKK